MQMAKISVAVEAAHKASIPFVSVLNDPTYGGVSASYAMQADVKIALSDARIGFAGPAVILNTMCGADQEIYDMQCPADFQSASYLLEHGQVDMVLEVEKATAQVRVLCVWFVCINSDVCVFWRTRAYVSAGNVANPFIPSLLSPLLACIDPD